MGGSTSAAAVSSTPRRPVFYLVGDSLTQDGARPSTSGWATILQDKYIRSIDVINRGHCGYDSRLLVEYALPVIVEELTHAFAPSLVTLWLGANDAALPNGPSKNQHVPLADYRKNITHALRTLVPLLPANAKLLLITPPPVIDAMRLEDKENNGELERSDAAAAEYARACADVGTTAGVEVLDMHSALSAAYPNAAERAALFSDGLHFTTSGNAVVAELLAAKIDEIFAGTTEAARFDAWQLPNFRDLIPKK